jgi:hypothetical protein
VLSTGLREACHAEPCSVELLVAWWLIRHMKKTPAIPSQATAGVKYFLLHLASSGCLNYCQKADYWLMQDFIPHIYKSLLEACNG